MMEKYNQNNNTFQMIIRAYNVVIIGMSRDGLNILSLCNLQNINCELKLLVRKYQAFILENELDIYEDSIIKNIDAILSIVSSLSVVERLAFEEEIISDDVIANLTILLNRLKTIKIAHDKAFKKFFLM